MLNVQFYCTLLESKLSTHKSVSHEICVNRKNTDQHIYASYLLSFRKVKE